MNQKLTDNLSEVMILLLRIFYMRLDLQREFPQVFSKKYRKLLEWALGVAEKRWDDSAYYTLKPCHECFKTLLSMSEIHDSIVNDWWQKHIAPLKKTHCLMKRLKYLLFGIAPLPEYVIIDPCNICNLKCPLCPSGFDNLGHPRKFMDKKTLNLILDRLPTKKYVYFFNWGEPLLNPNIIELIKCVKERDIIMTIDTNFNTTRKDDFFRSLINSGLDNLIISLDGVSQETYSIFRKNGNFNLVISNLEKIVNMKKTLKAIYPMLTWKFIVNKYNEHEILRAETKASTFGINFVTEKIGLSDYLPDTKFNDDIDQRKNKWLPKEKKYVYDHYVGDYNLPLYDEHCPRLFKTISITPDGKIFPCCWVTDENNYFGDLRKNTIKEIWNNSRYQYSRRLFKFSFKKNKVKPTVCYHCNNYRKRALSQF